MRTLRIASLLLLGSLAAAPIAAQGIPDNIPDRPGESLADRNRERMVERYRGLLGRFFTDGSVAMAPLGGPAYQLNAGVGLMLENGDAVLLAAGARAVPADPDGRFAGSLPNDGAWVAGVAYELSGTRVLGSSPLGWRTALGLGVGIMRGEELTAATFEVAPTYALLVGRNWSVPVAVRFSLSTIDNRDPDARLTRAFVGLDLGVRWHWLRRDRLD